MQAQPDLVQVRLSRVVGPVRLGSFGSFPPSDAERGEGQVVSCTSL